MGPGDAKGTAANTGRGLAAGEEVLGQDSRTELARPRAPVAMRTSLSLSAPLRPSGKDRSGLHRFLHPFWFLDGF